MSGGTGTSVTSTTDTVSGATQRVRASRCRPRNTPQPSTATNTSSRAATRKGLLRWKGVGTNGQVYTLGQAFVTLDARHV